MVGSRESGTKGHVKAMFVVAVREMSRAEYKRYRAWCFPHWYYTCDLGDGVSRRATIANAETVMPDLIGARSRSVYMLEKHVGDISGARLLDVACSAGFQTMEFAKRGAIVTGIDWDKSAIEQAQFIQDCVSEQIGRPVTFRCCSLFDFDAPEGEVDYVHCSGLLYHLRDPIGAVERLRRWARKGVVVACCVAPRKGDLFVLSDPSVLPFCATCEFALVPTATMVRQILEYAGLEIRTFADWTEFDGDPAGLGRLQVRSPPRAPVYAFARPKPAPESGSAHSPDPQRVPADHAANRS